MIPIISPNFEWFHHAGGVLTSGERFAPRGEEIVELPHRTITIPIERSVLTIAKRKLNYKFMVAEALWILHGRNDVGFLTPYNKKMADYSDDGDSLYGAYGPRYAGQREYVVNKLLEDRDTRQATLTLWRTYPRPSKDIPCTVALDFKIRNDVLHAHVFMRSSDVYLGLPYDLFTFSMMAVDILKEVNTRSFLDNGPLAVPGDLYITAASCHIYKRDIEAASACILDPEGSVGGRLPVAAYAPKGPPLDVLLERILDGREVPWWNG